MIFRYSAATTPTAEDGAKISLLIVWNINVLYNDAEKYNFAFSLLFSFNYGCAIEAVVLRNFHKGLTSQLRGFFCPLQL